MNAATLVTLLALHSHGPAHGPGHAERPTATCPASVVAAFDDLDDALRHMANDVENVRRQKDRQHLRAELARALERSEEARRIACRETRDDVVIVQPAPPPPVIVVLDEPQKRELVTVVRREAFDEERLAVLELGTRDVCVTAAQAKDLVKELTFSQPRIDAVRVLAPRIVDRDRSLVVLESLTFDSDRRAARDILASTPVAAHCSVRRG